ncbi:hypothetical protein BCM02_11770 [Paenibacillus methanolicus]|uniref:Uncharacterized protein n=1 Tax=Paenibacillus methanolicus TaxID=582686 RepID=A0A5S5BRY5_9BACL|nr:hypothetical protein BCM02_11770 [Paenibacillus methanolicus]
MRLHEEYMIEKLREYELEELRRADRRGIHRHLAETAARRRRTTKRITALLWLVRLLGIKR